MNLFGLDMKLQSREAVAAGSFYCKDATQLKENIESYFQRVNHVLVDPQLRAIITPHSTYDASGYVAAAAFASIPKDRKFKNVFLLGNCHGNAFDGVSINLVSSYETPLGSVPVQTQIAADLIRKDSLIRFCPKGHGKEHSLEVQIPFLQTHLDHEFHIVPIVIGTRSKKDCKKLAELLKPYFTEDNLFVISTDFSHYPNSKDAQMLDELTMRSIRKNSPDELVETMLMNQREHIPNFSTSMCGWAAVYTLLNITTKLDNIYIRDLMYTNSPKEGKGSYEQVVGHYAMSFSLEQ